MLDLKYHFVRVFVRCILSTSELYIWQNKMLDTRDLRVLLCVLNNHWLDAVLQCFTWTVCYWRNWDGRDIESPVQCVCGACNGWWVDAAAHWTERCRKWGARIQIWHEVLSAHWDGCVRVYDSSSSHYSWWLLEEIYRLWECVEAQKKYFD